MLFPHDPQIAKIPLQSVTRFRIQRIVVHYVFHIADGVIEPALVEMAFCQFAVEIRQMLLRIFVPGNFFPLMPLEIGGPPEIVLRPVDHSALMSLNALPELLCRNGNRQTGHQGGRGNYYFLASA